MGFLDSPSIMCLTFRKFYYSAVQVFQFLCTYKKNTEGESVANGIIYFSTRGLYFLTLKQSTFYITCVFLRYNLHSLKFTPSAQLSGFCTFRELCSALGRSCSLEVTQAPSQGGLLPTVSSRQSTFFSYTFVSSRHSVQMEVCNRQSFVSAIFHLACVFEVYPCWRMQQLFLAFYCSLEFGFIKA